MSAVWHGLGVLMSSLLFKEDKTYRMFQSLFYIEEHKDEWSRFLDSCKYPYVYAVHDMDEELNEDGLPTGSFKKVHAHVIFITQGLKGSTINKFLDTFGFVGGEPTKSKEGSIQYLIHKNNPEKYQYDSSIIKQHNFKSPLNIDGIVSGFIHKSVIVLDPCTSYKNSNKMSSESLKSIGDMVQSWSVPSYDVGRYFSVHEYINYSKIIKGWYEYRNNFVHEPPRDNDLLVFYVTGKSGTGKSYFIKNYLVPQIQRIYPSYHLCVCNKRFDNYNEEEILWLTELRGKDHSISELCRLTDTTINSPIPRRFYDVSSHFLRVVILDSLESLDTIGKSLDNDSKYDTVKQLERRLHCTFHITLEGPDELHKCQVQEGTSLVPPSWVYDLKERYECDSRSVHVTSNTESSTIESEGGLMDFVPLDEELPFI